MPVYRRFATRAEWRPKDTSVRGELGHRRPPPLSLVVKRQAMRFFDLHGQEQLRTLTLDNTNVSRYYWFVLIRSFKCAETQRLFSGERVKRFLNIETVAMRKLAMLNRAGTLDDLRVPPSNRLEKLGGDRKGQCSIRVNDQWRICFRWSDGDAFDVEITDYH